MAFSSQNLEGRGPTSLSLFKLSYCTTATHGAKLVWTHLSAQNDMFAVFDQVRKIGLGGSMSEKRVLKLTRGGDLLEQIELDDLVFQVRLDRQRMQSQQQLQDSSLYVIVIVKKPLVALRYQLPDGQIRRLQLNFLPESGYDVTVKVFTSLGLPIRDRNVHVDLPIPSLLQSSSQPLYSNISPVHSQEAFTSFQSLAPLAAQPPCLLPSPNLMPPSIIPNESPYDVRLCSSAPETYSEPRETAAPTLSQMLPPKRILPFPPKKPKPATPEPETAASNLNQESIQDGICPAVTAKKKPTRARTTKAKASASNPRPPRTAKLPANTNNSKRSEPASRTSTPKRTKRSANIVSPISPLIISPPEPAPLPSKPARRASKPAHPAISNPIATNSLTAVEPAEFMSRLDSWVREYQHLPAPQPRDAAAAMEDLTAYAAQSKEERLAVIDEMICECLEDENFGKLVEDVDESWRRIGLGF